MMDTNKAELVSRLRIEIEHAWNAKGDHEMVDRLAAEHPALAEELYEFFADVVEMTLESDERRHSTPELLHADERMREWLEREGYRKVAAAYEATRTNAGTTPTQVNRARSFLGFLRRATGESTHNLAASLDITAKFLVDVSDHPELIPLPARIELTRRVETARGIKQDVTLRQLAEPHQPLRKAASRSGAYGSTQTTYSDLVRRSGLNHEQQQYWLHLA